MTDLNLTPFLIIMISSGAIILIMTFWLFWGRYLLMKTAKNMKCPHCEETSCEELVVIKIRRDDLIMFCWACHGVFKLDTNNKTIKIIGNTLILSDKDE